MFRTTRALLSLFGIVVTSGAVTFVDEYYLQDVHVRAQFSDPDWYNSYDFGSFPLGMIEKDSLKLKASLGFQNYRWSERDSGDSLLDKTNKTFVVPEISVGVPGAMLFKLRYSPEVIESDNLSLPLHNFGLAIAAQIPSRYFQIGLDFNGFTGMLTTNTTDRVSGSNSERLLLGVDNLSLSVGSRLHETVSIGMSGGISVLLDTLRIKSESGAVSAQSESLRRSDRYFTAELPQLNWFVDVGHHDFPVEANVLVSTSKGHFVYVSGLNKDQNPMKTSDLSMKGRAAGNVVLSSLVVHPALCAGFWKQDGQMYLPTESNDNLEVGNKLPGQSWNQSSFYIGGGTSLDIVSFLTLWSEYTYSIVSLKQGTDWPEADRDRNGQYHHTQAGCAVRLHDIEPLSFPSSVTTTLNVGYVNRTVNKRFYTLSDGHFNRLTEPDTFSQAYRYTPDLWWSTLRLSALSLGIKSSFLDDMIGIDVSVAIGPQMISSDNSTITFNAGLHYTLH
jgi:opacity protein-like surface antigen